MRTLILGLLASGVLTSAAGAPGPQGRHAAPGRPAPPAARAPAGGIGIRLVDAPLEARANSRAWTYIIDHLAPGTVIHRRVEVFNSAGSPEHLSLYTAAGEIRDRRFVFAPGRTANELSTWTTTAPRAVTLAPRARSMVGVSIRVPRDAAPGERYGVIWAEARSPVPAGGGITEVNRVGVRMYLSVGPGNPPASAFTIDSLTAQRAQDGRQVVLAQVRNTGGRALDLTGELTLSDGPGSLSAGPFRVQSGTTLPPGASGPVTATLQEQVPDGPWRARIRLESGLTRRAAEATIRFPAAGGTARAVRAEMDASPVPLLALAGGVVFSALVAVKILLVRRNRRARGGLI